MSYSIFVCGSLKKSATMEEVAERVLKKCKKTGWETRWLPDSLEVIINVPPSDLLVLKEQNRKIDSFVDISTQSQDVPEKIFDILWSIKPLFTQFHIDDEYGLWDAYQLKKNKTKPLVLRNLTPIEEDELQYDLIGDINDSTLFFSTPACAVLMGIVYKDSSFNTKDELLDNLDEPMKAFWLDNQDSVIPEYVKNNIAFLCVCRDYAIKRLQPVSTNKVYSDSKKSTLADQFANTMLELVSGGYMPGMGTKYLSLVKFRQALIQQGEDFENRETVLRYIYSSMESIGLVRPESCKMPRNKLVD